MTSYRLPILSLALLLFAGGVAAAAPAEGPMEMEMALFVPARALRAESPPPLRLAERPGMQPLAELEPAVVAARDELDQLILWNRLGQLPVRNGFPRELPAARRISFGPELFGRGTVVGAHDGGLLERTAGGDLVWGTEVRVAKAWRLRLHLDAIELPAGAEMWVYGEDGQARGPFGLELRSPDGGLWTPSVGGEAIRLEVRLPAGAGEAATAGFAVDRVMELVDGSSGALGGMSIQPREGECLVDAQCINSGTFDVVDLAQRAIAAIEFIEGFSFVCTGGLLNSQSQGLFLLTANHCISSQAVASTVEATWDYYTSSCNGPAPDFDNLPKSNGSALVATGASSDYTLLRLNSIPSSRILLGWNGNASAAANGTVLNRISHPVHPETFIWLPQRYSRNRVDTGAQTCQGAPRPNFLYETFVPGMGDMGGTYGGSSGSPVIIAGGQVVGQLTGGCGLNAEDGCDYSNAEVDGAFSQSFAALGPILNAAGGDCIPSETTLCLRDNRFQVEVEWVRPSTGATLDANVVQGVQSSDSGLFYFLDPDNWEFLIKVLDGCNFNNPHYWVFFAATTNVEFTVTVTDTQEDETNTYTNPAGQPADAVTDTRAFATCP